LKCDNLLPINLYYDNKAAIKFVANQVFHERNKHIDIDLHFVREKITSRVIKTFKIESTNNTANIFTKGLDVGQQKLLSNKLNMVDLFPNETKGRC
jgi:hypothetical protein